MAGRVGNHDTDFANVGFSSCFSPSEQRTNNMESEWEIDLWMLQLRSYDTINEWVLCVAVLGGSDRLNDILMH